ncbi:ankyrin repeat and fibronectin type-III domain-containing protein 1-like isoform X1 [Alosa alosa]|nr:ankyrin repeat and fibronectin type-III domain-containing protein 1-like isoform X1 [Alosa alosa]
MSYKVATTPNATIVSCCSRSNRTCHTVSSPAPFWLRRTSRGGRYFLSVIALGRAQPTSSPQALPSVGMSLSTKEFPQRRKSLGPVSPKRIYRNLSVRLKGGESLTDGETVAAKHQCRASSTVRPNKETQLSCWVCFYTTLWEAVESEDTLAVQSLLSRDRACGGGEKAEQRGKWEKDRERGVNSISEQGLVPLDVAVLTHNFPLLQVLIKAGARHNPYSCRPSEWALKLDALVTLAGQKVEEHRRVVLSRAKAAVHLQASAQRQLHNWTLRHQLYCKMRESFHLTVLPGPPSSAVLHVTSASSLLVSVREPTGMATGLITRYRVEWSTSETFQPICGTGFITNIKSPVFHITGLSTGVPYHVRVSAYNVRGWGAAQTSSPTCAAPSSWLECNSVRVRNQTQEAELRRILEQIREPHYRGYCTEKGRQMNASKRRSVSRGLKQLFQSATKFVRLLQRGVYLATVFYHKDNFLVTAEDQFPLVEIQCCSTSIIQDFLWFAKLSCAWQQVPWLQQALSSSLSSSSSLLQNRQNILRAVAQLQSSLGTEDLGQVYFEPLKDRQGNVLLVTLRECSPPSHPPDPPLRWVPMSRLEKSHSHTPLLPEPTAMDTLTEQLKEKLAYHRRSIQQAQPGLYVGILKLCSSVEQLRVLVPQRLPNLLCHARVRSNPHVSREEWEWLLKHALPSGVDTAGEDDCAIESFGLEEFVHSLRSAVTTLLTRLNIPLYRAYQYRVYTQELLQFGDQLSMLLLLPPSEEFSASYWPIEGAQEPGITLPLQIFELVHFWAYARDFLSQYCQAWVRLELDAYLCQQALREALDSKEVSEAKERNSHITQLSKSLEVVWREARWIMDVMQCVRSKRPTSTGAVPLGLVMGGQPPPPSPAASGEKENRDVPIVLPPHLLNPQADEEGMNMPDSVDPASHDITVSGGTMPDLENIPPSAEEYALGAPAAEIQSFGTQYLSPPQPDIFYGAIGAQFLSDIQEEPGTLSCIKEPDFLHPCSLHEECVGEKEAVMVGEMLGMLDKLDLCGETFFSFEGLDPPIDPVGHFCVLGAECRDCTASLLESCSPATDINLEHYQPLLDQGSSLGFTDKICGLHEHPELCALEGPSMGFLPHSLLPSSPCGGTVNPSPGLDGESPIAYPTSRGSSMPVRSLVAWVTSADQKS